ARGVVEEAGAEVSSAQEAGSGETRYYVIKTGELSNEQVNEVRSDLAEALDIAPDQVNVSEVSSSWGESVTQQALIGLVVFLVLVAAYLWVRFEQKMAISALLALVHDLILTAGVYSLVGFEVTPGSVVGMLTILGFSLYDTVVVFDKVQENTRGLLGSNRSTYGEASNLAVNQTFMRSLNTTIIGILPVAGLLFVGAGMLGVGTLKDLALVLFVGMLAGAYSSLFIATPMLVDFKRFEPRYRAHEKRVLAKRSGDDVGSRAARRQAKRAAAAKASRAKAASDEDVDEDELLDEPELEEAEHDDEDDSDRELAGAAPRPGARTSRAQRKRPAGRSRGSRGGGKRRK
ncbi:MAG: protein translocase subunit SecF, partial [Micromonosporaceae bacterium]